MKYLALAALLFLAGYIGWHHIEHKPISLRNAVAKDSHIHPMGSAEWCKIYCEPPQDHRSQAQWEADCSPAWADKVAYNGTVISSMWCRTPFNNKFDHDSKLPSDWK